MKSALAVVGALGLSALGMDSAHGGDVLHVDWRDPTGFQTIQEAIDVADDGDTILVWEGEYAGAVVDRSVEVVGVEGVIIGTGVDVSAWPYGTRGFLVTADGVTISNLVIENAGIGIEGKGTETNPTVDDLTVSHVTIGDVVPVYADLERTTEQGSFGVFDYWAGSGWEITHNRIDLADGYPGYGVYIFNGHDNLVAFNQVDFHEQVASGSHYFGVILLNAQNNQVVHNKIVIDAARRGCVAVAGGAARDNTIGFNDFRGSTVEGVAAVWGASAADNLISGNLGENRSTMSDEDASEFRPVVAPD